LAYGKPGPCPPDDKRYRIKHYCETLFYLESTDNPQNEYKGERFFESIYEREIDYAVRAFGKPRRTSGRLSRYWPPELRKMLGQMDPQEPAERGINFDPAAMQPEEWVLSSGYDKTAAIRVNPLEIQVDYQVEAEAGLLSRGGRRVQAMAHVPCEVEVAADYAAKAGVYELLIQELLAG
jgi:hypothetical protein